MISKWNKYKLPVLATFLVLGIATMYGCPFFAENSFARSLLEIALLIPVILSGYWFGWAGGIGAAVLVAAAEVVFARMHGFPEGISYGILALAAGCFSGHACSAIRAEREQKKKALSDLEAANAELGKKTADLFNTEEEMRRGERLRVLGELSGELAHEIQNPLASIKGTAEILSDRCQHKCGTDEFMEILMSEIKRLRGVLDRFLDFARNQDTESPVCNAINSFEDVIRLMKHQMDKHRIHLHLNAPAGGCLVRISDEQMKQVFVNLVLNATQAMPEGGEIIADFEQTATEAKMTIRDTGPGIKDKDRERVFSPFFTTKRAGTGLGLSIVWRIVTKHGGSIKLATKTESPQKGACFIITLPRGHEGEMVVSKATA